MPFLGRAYHNFVSGNNPPRVTPKNPFFEIILSQFPDFHPLKLIILYIRGTWALKTKNILNFKNFKKRVILELMDRWIGIARTQTFSQERITDLYLYSFKL